MQVTLIRHLPTKWNLEHKLQGKRNLPILPITEFLKIDIEKNKEKLNALKPPTLILSSTLIRTQQTAEAYGYQPETERLLNELDFGPYEGNLKSQLIKDAGELWYRNPKQSILGEQIADLEIRIKMFLQKYKNEQHVLVFGHGSWIRAFISYIQTRSVDFMNQIHLFNNEMNTYNIRI